MNVRLRDCLSLLLLLAVPACAEAQVDTPAAQREFARNILPELREAFPDATLVLSDADPLQLEISGHPDWEDGQINLHRVYYYCRENTAADCAAVRADFAAGIAMPRPVSTAADLRVLVRDEQYAAFVRDSVPGEEVLAMRRLGEDLWAFLAIDSPNAIALATPGDLSDFGLDEQAAWNLALEQTRAILPPMPKASAIREAMQFYSDPSYEYLPSMLYPAEDWSAIAAEVGPDLAVTAVSDQMVLVATVADADLPRSQELVGEDCRTAPRCVSPNVYRYRNGRWVVAR